VCWLAEGVGVVRRKDEAGVNRRFWGLAAARGRERWQGHSGEVFGGALTGGVTGVEAVKAPSLILALANDVLVAEATKAAALELLFKGRHGGGVGLRRPGGIERGVRRRED
jgi:hypothetical protein